MKITQQQFEHELQNPKGRKFNIIFIGMSGSGKTHWSKLLAEQYGYRHIEFDTLIGNSPEVASLISDVPGRDAAEKMGNYFGMPWSSDFQSKEAGFLEIESRFMSSTYPLGSILDLTGSCVYHPEQMAALAATGLVVYLETSEDKQREMLEIFKKHPKPVIWGGIFDMQEGEGNDEALERCYPLLLRQRVALYAAAADVVLSHDSHKGAQSLDEIVQGIRMQLPRRIGVR